MAVNNGTILAKAWLEGTNDFQQRIPDPSQSGYDLTLSALFAPMNHDLYNVFEGLMNMIGMTYVMSRKFENPLAEFKKQPLAVGKTVREIMPRWFRAHTFKVDNEDLLKFEAPEYEQWFHSVNRQEYYTFSWTPEEVKFALAEGPDSDGLNRLIAGTMDALMSSDNYDEMNYMLQLFAEVNSRWGGIYNKYVPEPVDNSSANAFLAAVRGIIYRLGCTATRLYNTLQVPVFARPDELILLVTPEVRANLDVNAWAAAFNLDYATTLTRIVTVPELPLPNVYAVLTTVDFYQCRDSVYGIFNAPFNPETMSNKYYLQHWEIISASPAVPVIAFTSDESTEVDVLTETFTGVSMSIDSTTVEPGGTYQITITAQGNADEPLEVKPAACRYEVSSDGKLNSRTYVDKFGVLHVQRTGLDSGDTLTITGYATYLNPSNNDAGTYSDETTVTVA